MVRMIARNQSSAVFTRLALFDGIVGTIAGDVAGLLASYH
jgi:hypothetical protein